MDYNDDDLMSKLSLFIVTLVSNWNIFTQNRQQDDEYRTFNIICRTSLTKQSRNDVHVGIYEIL